MNPLGGIPARILALIVGVIALILIVGSTVRSCDQRHARAAQGRLDHGQAEAASNSAADAIGTVARSGEAAAASEDLTRDNERDIRGAQGASDPVTPAARDAGITALCKRKTYENDPRCRRP